MYTNENVQPDTHVGNNKECCWCRSNFNFQSIYGFLTLQKAHYTNSQQTYNVILYLLRCLCMCSCWVYMAVGHALEGVRLKQEFQFYTQWEYGNFLNIHNNKKGPYKIKFYISCVLIYETIVIYNTAKITLIDRQSCT